MEGKRPSLKPEDVNYRRVARKLDELARTERRGGYGFYETFDEQVEVGEMKELPGGVSDPQTVFEAPQQGK